MLVIGFANDYYTLWEVVGESATYYYNLSKDLSAAVAKVKELNPTFDPKTQVDLDLRGENGSRFPIAGQPDEFSFGKLRGEKILEATDEWQLSRAMRCETTANRRRLAQDRLQELNWLVEYQGVLMPRLRRDQIVQREAQVDGWYETNGKRLDLELSVAGVWVSQYPNQWGQRSSFYVLVDSNNRVFRYKGNSGLIAGCSTLVRKGDKIRVKATIAHDTYQGQQQTRLMRPKVAFI